MKVSIITATHNSESTIRSTLESVLQQTYYDIEYIIIDGASVDNTKLIIKEFEPRFNGRLKVISEPDNGIYDAINKGIRLSTGNIIGILNSDDFYTSKDVLERIVYTLKHNSCDGVYGDIHYVNNNDLSTCVRYYSSAAFRKWTMRLGLMPAHPSFYVYKKVYEKYGLYSQDYKIAADFELLLRFIYVHKISILYIPMDFVTMRRGGISTSGFQSHKTISTEHLRALRANNIYSNIFLLALRYIYKTLEILYFKIFKSKKF